jgi:hypothetical protein
MSNVMVLRRPSPLKGPIAVLASINPSSDMSARITFPPRSSQYSARARPIPPLPPVITATEFFISSMFIQSPSKILMILKGPPPDQLDGHKFTYIMLQHSTKINEKYCAAT